MENYNTICSSLFEKMNNIITELNFSQKYLTVILGDKIVLIRDDQFSYLTIKQVNLDIKIEIDCTTNQYFELLFCNNQSSIMQYVHHFVLVMFLCFDFVVTNVSHKLFKVYHKIGQTSHLYIPVKYYSGGNFNYPYWVVGTYNFIKIMSIKEVVNKINTFFKIVD